LTIYKNSNKIDSIKSVDFCKHVGYSWNEVNEIMIVLNEQADKPLYFQIYKQLKDKILSGELVENSKLPSTRVLAKTLNVGRNTVEYAYLQLCSEGYIESKVGSGFVINKIDNISYSAAEKQNLPNDPRNLNDGTVFDYKYNFQYGKLNPNDFPLKLWRKYTNYSLSSLSVKNIVAYNDRQGEIELRMEIMKYLKMSRGVHCQPEQIVICAGTQPCLTLLCQLFRQYSTDIAFEDPAYDGARDVFINNGYNVVPIMLEEDGIDLAQLEKTSAKIVYITPSHQFPTGTVLPIRKRMNLLDWALRKDAIIIEDDYDSELRYNSKPIPSLQNLDIKDRVVYIGTFSKILAPALRLSYMVLPQPWLDRYQKKFGKYNNPVPWLQQKTLENFMIFGHWERHLRKVCLIQKKKHDILIRTIGELMGDQVIIHGENAGLHILLEFSDGKERELIDKAKRCGVIVYPVSRYWMCSDKYSNNMVLLGFSSLNEHDIVSGLKLLKAAWFGD